MELIGFIQKFFVFLLPGIVGTYIYTTLNIHKEHHYYFEIIKILIISFFSYLSIDVLFAAIKALFPCFVFDSIDIVSILSSNTVAIPKANMLSSIVVAIIMACYITKAYSFNWMFVLANKLKLTRRTDNKTVWERVFDDSAVVVLRDTVTTNTYYGKVSFYSDNSDNKEIYFEDVYVYTENSDFLYHAEKLYLSRAHNEFTVEIQNDQTIEKGETHNE